MTCDRLVVSLGTPVSSTNKTDRCDIAEILQKVALNNIPVTFYFTSLYTLNSGKILVSSFHGFIVFVLVPVLMIQ